MTSASATDRSRRGLPLIKWPALFVFISSTEQVLITKLRSANSVETQQYRKGSKALLVLIPLLGLTHVLVIAGPTMGMSRIIFDHIQAVLLSTQVSLGWALSYWKET